MSTKKLQIVTPIVTSVNGDTGDITLNSLKNPNALTFTGAATGSYDGSSAKTVNIPSVPTTEISANTQARHSHSNKDILDKITGIVSEENVNEPAHISDLVDYSGFVAGSNAIINQIPKKVSALTNDANYATTTEVNNKLSLSGGTMTGDIDMGQNSLNNVGEIRMPNGDGGAYITPAGTPTAPSLEILGLNGDEPVEITGVANPTSNGSAANKSYVDTGLAGKANSSHNHSASNITSGTLPIARGGTNASTAAAARTNLGFSYGTSVPTSAPATGNGAVFFCQDSGSPLSIANGGTGASTAAAAISNLGIGATISSVESVVVGANNWKIATFTNGYVIATDTWYGTIRLSGGSFGSDLFYLRDTWSIPSGKFTDVYSANVSYQGPGIVVCGVNEFSTTSLVCSVIGSDNISHSNSLCTVTVIGYNKNKDTTL